MARSACKNRQTTDSPATTKAERLTLWTLPEFSLETDARLVLTPDGQLAGYIELWDLKPHVRHYLWGRVHPDHRGRGIGGQMMAWAEIRARESLDRAPPQARVSLHTSAPYQDKAAHDLFQVLGFSLARHFYRMIIEMAPGILPPKPPPVKDGAPPLESPRAKSPDCDPPWYCKARIWMS